MIIVRRAVRRLPSLALVGLMAMLMTVQASAMAWLNAAGPSHVHGGAGAHALVDFRRPPLAELASDVHTHDQLHELGARHHHGDLDDVVYVADDFTALEHADDDSRSVSGGAFFPLVSEPPTSLTALARELYRATTLWSVAAATSTPLERPPR